MYPFAPFVFAVITLLAGCATVPAPPRVEHIDGVHFTHLGRNVWMHATWKDIAPWGPIVSHGLVVAHETTAILVDTAWDDAGTATILAWAEHRGHPITAAVLTHAHDDKMGGVGTLRDHGIATFAHPLSNTLAPTRGLVPAEHDLAFDDAGLATHAAMPGLTILYPGPGHTIDNIVVAIDGTAILFGGCLIRPGDATTLGNTADGDIGAWANTTRRVATTFPDATLIVPSHGAPGDRRLLSHTEMLATPR
jgi:metallo-beta-lactamase class B